MSAIYKYLSADESEMPMLWLAGPVTGLVVQPIIGATSDKTWVPNFGRRKPFFLIGAIIASASLFLMPYSSSLWMAAGLLWILDASNNIALEPYRAFVSDKLKKKQHSLGFLMQSFLTGLGSTLSNFTPAILITFGFFSLSEKMDNGIPTSTYWAFFIGAIASIASVLYTIFTTSEIPPTPKQLAKLNKEKSKVNLFSNAFMEIFYSMKSMPKTMIQLMPVQFFSWYAMFCYWMYLTSTLAITKFDFPLEFINDDSKINESKSFASAQLLTGQMNGTYNIICFLVAFLLVPITIKLGAKKVHFICLLLGGIGVFCIPYLDNNLILLEIPNIFGENSIKISAIYLSSLGIGITWASIMAMPYQLLAGSIPKQNWGVYGHFQYVYSVPMIIQIFTVQYFVYDLLGSNPIHIVQLGGVFLILAGISSLFIKTNKSA